MCWPTSTTPAPPTDLQRRSMDDWNTCAAQPSGSATSPTTSHDRSSRPADSDPTYTLDPDEPLITGPSAVGKTTACVALMRFVYTAFQEQCAPELAAGAVPVAYVEVPP